MKYHIPTGVQAGAVRGRPVLSTPQAGHIAVDAALLALWQQADGRSLPDVLALRRAEDGAPDLVRAALACLAEAGLLDRQEMGAYQPPTSAPLHTAACVSAVVVGFNSRAWLADSLPSLLSQSGVAMEVVVVDNGSADNSADWIAGQWPQVKLVRLLRSVSFARACNQGAAAAGGDYLLFVNPDVRLEPEAVAQMVAVAQADPTCAAVAANLRLWGTPAFLNGLGNYVREVSWGSDLAIGHLDLGQFDEWREVPSACFAAALIPRAAWERVGPLDEGFPMYYEDVEWCYRARRLGGVIRAAPRAIVYHAFGGGDPERQADRLPARKLRNSAYGRLRFVAKLAGPELEPLFLGNYRREDLSNGLRAVLRGEWAAAAAYGRAWADFGRDGLVLARQREGLEAASTVSTRDVFALPRADVAPRLWRGLPALTWESVRREYWPLIRQGKTRPMPEFENRPRRPHLLVVSHDVVDVKMAGSGMRYLEICRALAVDLDVTLAVPGECSLAPVGFRIVRYWEERPETLQVWVENSDAAFIAGYMVKKFPFLRSTPTRLIVDLANPLVFENLHYFLNDPMPAQQANNQEVVEVNNQLARLGDFFVCGSERQRDYWLGVLTANQRVNPLTFGPDPDLRGLIDVVGPGLPDQPLAPTKPHLRGVHPGFGPETKIVWWGSVWNWLDPITLIKAWPQVVARHPEARLVINTGHPNPDVPQHRVALEAQRLAEALGERDRTIFFLDWIAYDDRQALLNEADVGAVLHPLHLETHFSVRTRVLDFIWARLPILIADGDVMSQLVRARELGRVVPPLDVEATARALVELLDRPRADWAPSFAAAREALRWSRVVEPLLRYCLAGDYAPDRRVRGLETWPVPPRTTLLGQTLAVWRSQGPRAVAVRAYHWLRWALFRR